ncbi:MAG: hypothetical protein AAF438_15640, partial [Pseudomonadota bacterium]
SPNDLHYEEIDQTTGLITAEGETPYHGDYSMIPPIRVSVDGSLVLIGSGDLFDANDMTWVAALPRQVTDMEWLNDGRIVSIRPNGADTALETYDASYQVATSAVVDGLPTSMHRYGDTIVIVTEASIPAFTVVTP